MSEESVGQEFRKATAGTACLCSMILGPQANSKAGGGLMLGKESLGGIFTHMFRSWHLWLVARTPELGLSM